MPTTKMPESANQAPSLTSSDILPEFAEMEREFEAKFAALPEPEKPVKRKRTSQASPIESSLQVPTDGTIEIDPRDIEGLVCDPLDMIFERGKKKKLSQLERLSLSRNVAAVINKYGATMIDKYGPELGLAVAALTIFGSRYDLIKLIKPKKIQPEKQPEETKSEGDKENANS